MIKSGADNEGQTQSRAVEMGQKNVKNLRGRQHEVGSAEVAELRSRTDVLRLTKQYFGIKVRGMVVS